MIYKHSVKTKIVCLITVLCLFISLSVSYIQSEAASDKVTVYVVTKITASGKWKNDANQKAVKESKKFEYSYNKNGLVDTSSESEKHSDYESYITSKCFYKGKYIVKGNVSSDITQSGKNTSSKMTITYSRNKNNVLTKMTYKENGKKSTDKFKIKRNSKKQITFVSCKNSDFKINNYSSYEYDSKERISKYNDAEIKYDSHGYAKSVGSDKIKNSYKSGRLTKRVLTSEFRTQTYKIQYKKISIPKKYKDAVERQQRYIIEYEYDIPWYY